MRNTRNTIQARESHQTIEEMGVFYNSTIKATLSFDVFPEEPRTWEDPGCPGHIEMTGFTATTYTNGDVWVTREERPDWFAWLDKIVENHVNKNLDMYEELIGEDFDDGDDDRAYDAWRERDL